MKTQIRHLHHNFLWLNSYLWEYNRHWIWSVFCFKSTVFKYSHSVGAEFSIQEGINEEDLSNDINKIKDFTKEKPI